MTLLDKLLRATVRKPPQRPAGSGAERLMSRLSLYHFDSCPFCLRVRRELARMGLEIELRNIHSDPSRYQELVTGGGSQQVPCLRIEHDDERVEWLYESSDIVAWLVAELRASETAEAV